MKTYFAFAVLYFQFVFSFSQKSNVQYINEDSLLNGQYYLLMNYLEEYKSIKKNGGWKMIDIGHELIIGTRDDRVKQLRERLEITKELLPDNSTSLKDSFDINLENSAKIFQEENGITPNGSIDKKTLNALNVSIDKRIKQIEKNMERWKVLPDSLGAKYIFVNTADFKLSVLENDSLILDMKVIVGRYYRSTPTFSANMTYLDFNPHWFIPPGIFQKDILPKIKNDSSFIKRMNIHVFEQTKDGVKKEICQDSIKWQEVIADSFRYYLVQYPGNENPMGTVKFIFPNKYSVYMHDTPDKKLFEKEKPTFSSGCIRLSKAKELAEYLLKENDGWDLSKIDSVISTGETTRIIIYPPIKIYIQYVTAWVDKAGRLNFREDIYGRDK